MALAVVLAMMMRVISVCLVAVNAVAVLVLAGRAWANWEPEANMWNLFVVAFATAFSAAVWWLGMHFEWPYLLGFAMGGFCGYGASDLIREDQQAQQEKPPPGSEAHR